jgi:hypothetical protein
MDASIPQNDRELLLTLNSEIKKLSSSIIAFSQTLEKIEVQRIGGLEKRVETLEDVWTQMKGGWKFALVVWTLVSATGVIGIIKWILT